MPYYFSGDFLNVHVITFPTKLSIFSAECEYDNTDPCDSPSDDSNNAVFRPNQNYSAVVQPKYWDMKENTPGVGEDYALPYEVNFLYTEPPFIDANYSEGWFRYDFNATTICSPLNYGPDTIQYTGAPAIAFSWIYRDNGVATVPSAHTDGIVSYNGTEMLGYQHHNA